MIPSYALQMEACYPLFVQQSLSGLRFEPAPPIDSWPLDSSRLEAAFLRAVLGVPQPQLCANLAALGLCLSIPNFILRENAYSSPYRLLISFCRHSSATSC